MPTYEDVFPSVHGVAEASLPSLRGAAADGDLAFPQDLASVVMHSRTRSFLSAAVRKMRSFQMIGVELPMPEDRASGRRSSLHEVGARFLEMPSLLGPRGQSSAWTNGVNATRQLTTSNATESRCFHDLRPSGRRGYFWQERCHHHFVALRRKSNHFRGILIDVGQRTFATPRGAGNLGIDLPEFPAMVPAMNWSRIRPALARSERAEAGISHG